MESAKLRINGARLRASLETMAKIGATPGGGVQRLTLSDEDKRGRDQIVAWMKEIDLAVRIDEMGNIFGRRPGKNDCPAAGHERLARRQPAQGRPVRRHPRGDGRPGGHADPAREQGPDRSAPGDRGLDQRGGLPVRPRHGRLRRVGRRAGAGLGVRPYRHQWKEVRRGAGAHRVQGQGAREEMARARLLRAAHRAGADARASEEDHRRAEGHPLPALVRRVPDRRGEPGRSHAHGGPARRAVRGRGDDPRHQHAARPHGRQHGRHGRRDPEQAELAQHHPRRRAFHRGHQVVGRRARAQGVGAPEG